MEIATYATLSREVDLGGGYFLIVQPTKRPDRFFIKVTKELHRGGRVQHRHFPGKRFDNQEEIGKD